MDAFFAILPYTCTEAGPSLYISQLQAGVRSSAGEEEQSVVANFRKTVDCIGTAHTLTVTKSGTGSGQVHTVDPDSGIDCGDDCDESYAEGTAVQLAAVADEGSVFAGWEGDGTDVEGDAGTVRSLTMDGDKAVNAVFNKIPDEDLVEMTVSLAGDADGGVTSDPAGIDCTKTGASVTGDCAAPFERGTTVTLTADPADGAVVGGWTGATGSGNTATVMMNDDLDVITTFEVQALLNFITLEAYLTNVESIRFVWGDFSLPGGASRGASAPAGMAGFAAAAATVCPPVIVAGHGGAVALDPCTGTTLQTYPVSEDADYYDAFTLPVPEGENGLHSVLVTGESYTQFFVDDAGAVVAHATSLSHGTYFDGSYIGNDPALGAAVARVNGDLSFMQWSESSNEYAFLSGASGDYLAPAMQSAAVDATAKRFLTVGNEGDNGVLYFSDFTNSPLHVEKIADLAGDNPRRIRCDYASGVCAISDFANSLITIVAWDGETAPTITDVTETGSIADGPVGIDVYGRTIVAAGFNDDQYAIIHLNTDGTIASVSVNPLPAECTQPGHAIFLRDAMNTILASCYGSTGIARVPDAF